MVGQGKWVAGLCCGVRGAKKRSLRAADGGNSLCRIAQSSKNSKRAAESRASKPKMRGRGKRAACAEDRWARDEGRGASPVLEAVKLPACVTDLGAGLANVDGDALAHVEVVGVC